jgi:hypothetical protein
VRYSNHVRGAIVAGGNIFQAKRFVVPTPKASALSNCATYVPTLLAAVLADVVATCVVHPIEVAVMLQTHTAGATDGGGGGGTDALFTIGVTLAGGCSETRLPIGGCSNVFASGLLLQSCTSYRFY